MVVALLAVLSVQAAGKNLLWDTEHLLALNSDDDEYKSIVRDAELYLKQPIPLITEKLETLSGDNHNYESLATYFWPNQEDSTASYVVRDGHKNPERLKYDGNKINVFARHCSILAKAYAITHDAKYSDRWIEEVSSWFIDEETIMNPHLEYAQIIKNRNNNQGQYFGIIDAYVLIDVVESIELMRKEKVLNNDEYNNIQSWFWQFSSWLETSALGKSMDSAPNNLSIAYDIMMCEFLSLCGNEQAIVQRANSFTRKRLYKQFLANGSQPEEMKRAKPISYCIYNLQHVLDFCRIMQNNGIKYYRQNRRRIDAAIEFVERHLTYEGVLVKAEESQRTHYMKQLDDMKAAFKQLR